MERKEVIEDIRKALQDVKAQQQKVVSVDALENYLDVLEEGIGVSAAERAEAHQANLEHYKAQNTANLAQYEATAAGQREMFRSVVQAGQKAINSSMLINGGAAVALLAFLGRIWDTGQSPAVASGLTLSLLKFLGGVLAATVAFGTTYLTQFTFGHGWNKTGHSINVISMLLVIGSYILFLWGGHTAYEAFVAQLQPR